MDKNVTRITIDQNDQSALILELLVAVLYKLRGSGEVIITPEDHLSSIDLILDVDLRADDSVVVKVVPENANE